MKELKTAMKSREELRLARKEIGKSLLTLRNKEEESATTISLVKKNLSLALRLQGKILRLHPSLRRIRVKQMRLL